MILEEKESLNVYNNMSLKRGEIRVCSFFPLILYIKKKKHFLSLNKCLDILDYIVGVLNYLVNHNDIPSI